MVVVNILISGLSSGGTKEIGLMHVSNGYEGHHGKEGRVIKRDPADRGACRCLGLLGLVS